jgi:hypothetical protein
MATFQELIAKAKDQAQVLCMDNTQIRVTADEASYWVFRSGGSYYIGILTSENVNPKFPLLKNRKVLEFERTTDKAIIAKVQFLMYVS